MNTLRPVIVQVEWCSTFMAFNTQTFMMNMHSIIFHFSVLLNLQREWQQHSGHKASVCYQIHTST